ncbi:hypothetical protein FGL83_05495 [Leuconostoc lactis]|uniref:Uncharacterized protein n=1 Tax=Leuconostoc lactis TaxID=1246 RepID=A0AAP9ECL3_LEULA|nr:hypothetical protein [Leuconostoc lactis]QEA44148.1 hypothetical protein FGL83_05495 [Leuconostoc lactis]
MEGVVNVFLCRDGRDIQMSMVEYEDEQRRFNGNVKVEVNRHKRTVTINDGWITKFVSEPKYLDGMHIREITISTRMSTGGDLDKLQYMLVMARQGRLAFKNAQMIKQP